MRIQTHIHTHPSASTWALVPPFLIVWRHLEHSLTNPDVRGCGYQNLFQNLLIHVRGRVRISRGYILNILALGCRVSQCRLGLIRVCRQMHSLPVLMDLTLLACLITNHQLELKKKLNLIAHGKKGATHLNVFTGCKLHTTYALLLTYPSSLRVTLAFQVTFS